MDVRNAMESFFNDNRGLVDKRVQGLVLGNARKYAFGGTTVGVRDSVCELLLGKAVAEGRVEDDDDSCELFWDAFCDWYGRQGIYDEWVERIVDEGHGRDVAEALCL